MRYKFLSHTADVKFRAYGKDLNKCFANSAVAMFKAMYPGRVNRKIKKVVEVKGKDLESLLYNFLEELLVLLDSKDFFVSRADVKVDWENFNLVARIEGDRVSNYSVSLQVKAVTYNEMFVKKVKGMWVSQVVLDV